MYIDILFSRKDFDGRELQDSVVVVADVLRATSVMIEALNNGANAIIPQADEQSARTLYTIMQEQGIPLLLAGERDGFKIDGFDLGNSPLEFTPTVVKDKTIIHLTTNGTKTLVAAGGAREIMIASFCNRMAVARLLSQCSVTVNSILLTASGRFDRYCLEDTVCLGGIIEQYGVLSDKQAELSDAAVSALDLYKTYEGRLLEMVRSTVHGRYLESVGLGDDLPECIKLDTTEITPFMKNGRVVL